MVDDDVIEPGRLGHFVGGGSEAAVEVGWGDQSWEEMMIGFFSLAVDMDHDPDKLYKGLKKDKPKAEQQESTADGGD